MTPQLFVDLALQPALRLLPVQMSSPAAMAMIVAIALQESGLKTRQQIGGPARSYLQFERGGVAGVLTHSASSVIATRVCAQLDFPSDATVVYAVIGFNDVLACVFGRLLLWTLPQSLPDADEPDKAWSEYLSAWRPGKPHRETWNAHYETAWRVVAEATKDS